MTTVGRKITQICHRLLVLLRSMAKKDLPVCDTGLGSLRIVKYVLKIAHHPNWKTSISNLEIIGKPYWLAKERADSCNRSKCSCCMSFKSLSENVQTLSVSNVISGKDIEHLKDRLYFTDDIIVVTGRTSIDMNSSEMKVIKVEENDARKSLGYRLNDNVNFSSSL